LFSRPRSGVTSAVKMIAIPAACYLLWLVAMRAQFPHTRNSLLYYPLMTTFEQFDPEQGLVEIIRGLPANHWRQLAMNRWFHVRQYLDADVLSDPIIDRFRWISLPNVFGVGLLVLVAARGLRAFRGDAVVVGLIVLGPLLFHHLYLGQGSAQFHITPLPFYGIGLFAAGEWLGWCAPASGRRWSDRVLAVVVVIEIFLRHCYPVYVVVRHPELRGEPPLDVLGFFGRDAFSYVSLALLLPLCWTAVAWWAMRGTGAPSPDAVGACRRVPRTGVAAPALTRPGDGSSSVGTRNHHSAALLLVQ
jgi:hypothetical protein